MCPSRLQSAFVIQKKVRPNEVAESRPIFGCASEDTKRPVGYIVPSAAAVVQSLEARWVTPCTNSLFTSLML